MLQTNQDESTDDFSNQFSKALKILMKAIKTHISAEVKNEVKAALATRTITTPTTAKPSLKKPKNYDKFKLIYLETGRQKIFNKRTLAKAVYEQLISVNTVVFSSQELSNHIPTGKRTFLEVTEAKRKNLIARYYMDSPYLTSDQKEVVFTNEWSIDTIMQLQQYVANNEAIFKLKIEKTGE